LPRTVGGLVANLFGFPIRVAEQIDERLPVVGAVAAGGTGDAGPGGEDLAVAIHVKNAPRFAAQVSTGTDGSFTSQLDDQGELTWLRAKSDARAARLSAALALLDNYLLIGNSETALRRLGPYLTRTLAPRSHPAGGVIVDLMPAAFGDALRGHLPTWHRMLTGLPLPAQLGAFVDLQGVATAAGAFLADLGKGRVTVTLDAQALVVSATASPRDEAAAKRLGALPTVHPGDLLELPDDTLVALGWAETLASRVQRAAHRGPAVAALLGDDLSDADRVRLAGVLEALAKGQGDQLRLGLRCTGVGITGFATGSVANAETLSAGLEALVELRKHPAVIAQLEARSLSIQAKKSRVLLVPHDVWKVRLTPLTKPGSETVAPKGDGPSGPRPIALTFGASEQRFWAAAGLETVATLQHLYRPDKERSLASKDGLKDALGRLGEQAWLVVLLDPQGMHACLTGKPGGALATPVALAAGPGKKGQVQFRLEIARPLLRVVVKELGGF
jgi:hypothetical protein